MKNRELSELCGKVRDGTLTEEEQFRLETELEANADSRRYYLEFLQLDSLLHSYPPIGDVESDHLSLPLPFRTSTSSRLGWSVAAALVLLLVGVFLWKGDQDETSGARSYATLILSESCKWETRSLLEGQRLGKGLLELQSGTAVIRFDGGAEAVLVGPIGLDIASAFSASLTYGEVVIRAESGAEGFILDTPTGRLIDLGTEFAVRVSKEGNTELHVHEGEVALGSDSKNLSEVIEAGAAVRINKSSEIGPEPVDLSAPRFQELLSRAAPKERRDLMTAYEGFHVEPGVYRPYQLNGGKGWAGPWRPRREGEINAHHPNAARKMTIAHSQMDITWPIRGGRAGMLETPQGPSFWLRKMKKPIRMDQWGIHYFSFLVTEPPEGDRAEITEKSRNDFRFTFRSSRDYFGQSLSLGWERNQRPRVSTNDWKTVRSIRTVPSNETVFCVAKFETRKTGTDRISFRFYTSDDELDLIEPAEWDVILSGFRHDAVYDLLVLTSNSTGTRYVDEVRVGPSWRSVTPVETPSLLMSSNE